jgi:hypothetical protein
MILRNLKDGFVVEKHFALLRSQLFDCDLVEFYGLLRRYLKEMF